VIDLFLLRRRGHIPQEEFVSHTLRVARYLRRAASMMTRNAQHRVLVPLTSALSDAAITRIRVLFVVLAPVSALLCEYTDC